MSRAGDVRPTSNRRVPPRDTSIGFMKAEMVAPRWNRADDRTLTFLPVTTSESAPMGISTILLIILVLLLVGALPTWPHSAGWGYYPSGGLGILLIIVIILLVSGRL